MENHSEVYTFDLKKGNSCNISVDLWKDKNVILHVGFYFILHKQKQWGNYG